ncbi:M1-specific T cell receptor beta chain-like [Anguilla rostrata]|uniref:M1-specific T cell receptor beta chain-like n=1 Tax=Anguilla rostrata TaxID=7938 RepID=UPI0030D1ADEE
MTFRALIGFSILLYWLFCATGGVEFEQYPSLIAKPGENREIKCSHSESNYHNMYWYRRALHDRVLVLVVFGHSREKPTYEAQFQTRFHLTREAVNRSSLRISALTVEDTAVYFCAASSHSAISYKPRFEQHFGGGTRLTVVDPHVPVTPPQVRVLPPAPQEVQRSSKSKSKVTLVCVATGFYPDHIRVLWKVNGVEVGASGEDSSPMWDGSSSTYSLSSRIRIPAQDWLRPQNSFTCVTSFYNGSHDLINNHTIFGDGGHRNYSQCFHRQYINFPHNVHEYQNICELTGIFLFFLRLFLR